MSRKRNDKGQFETQYDWPTLIPKICDEYGSGANLGAICAQPGYPTPWAVWYAINHNSEYRERWRGALLGQKYLLIDELGRLAEMCQEAVTNAELNPLALRVMLNTLTLKCSNLERAYEKYGVVKKPYTGRKEQSLEDELQAARKRAWGDNGRKPREHSQNGRAGPL